MPDVPSRSAKGAPVSSAQPVTQCPGRGGAGKPTGRLSRSFVPAGGLGRAALQPCQQRGRLRAPGRGVPRRRGRVRASRALRGRPREPRVRVRARLDGAGLRHAHRARLARPGVLHEGGAVVRRRREGRARAGACAHARGARRTPAPPRRQAPPRCALTPRTYGNSKSPQAALVRIATATATHICIPSSFLLLPWQSYSPLMTSLDEMPVLYNRMKD